MTKPRCGDATAPPDAQLRTRSKCCSWRNSKALDEIAIRYFCASFGEDGWAMLLITFFFAAKPRDFGALFPRREKFAEVEHKLHASDYCTMRPMSE